MESALRRGAGAPGLRLIETLGWDGTRFARLNLHLARLAGAACLFEWPCDVEAVRLALHAAVDATPMRVRLTLDMRGDVAVTTAPMPAGETSWQIGLALVPLLSTDPWLSVKSTQRAAYDAARANLPGGIDEIIFQNERGEVCDGSITTLFFDAGAGLCTPPLTCGVLPGVLRAEMLADGTVREAVLHAADVGRVQLWVGNSLRGLIPAVFVDQVRT